MHGNTNLVRYLSCRTNRFHGKIRLIDILQLCAAMLGMASVLVQAGNAFPLFDKPLREIRTPLPRDPENPQAKPVLSCFYYPNYMVKQVDIGEKGAELSIVPYWLKENKKPRCVRANVTDEMVFEWSGYFGGVSGDFVFLVSADGSDGGLIFAVFNAVNASRIFVDSEKVNKYEIDFVSFTILDYPKNDRDSARDLHYRRVYRAPCSLRADEKNCWSLMRRITGLTEPSPPSCAAAYEAERKRSPENASSLLTDPSVITYDVEVVLDLGSTIQVKPVSKAIECYPAE